MKSIENWPKLQIRHKGRLDPLDFARLILLHRLDIKNHRSIRIDLPIPTLFFHPSSTVVQYPQSNNSGKRLDTIVTSTDPILLFKFDCSENPQSSNSEERLDTLVTD